MHGIDECLFGETYVLPKCWWIARGQCVRLCALFGMKRSRVCVCIRANDNSVKPAI